MMAAMVEAGIEPTDFDHIIFASSGSFAGMGFALGRMPNMVKYCEDHGPSETISFPTLTASVVPNVLNAINSIDAIPASIRKLV